MNLYNTKSDILSTYMSVVGLQSTLTTEAYPCQTGLKHAIDILRNLLEEYEEYIKEQEF